MKQRCPLCQTAPRALDRSRPFRASKPPTVLTPFLRCASGTEVRFAVSPSSLLASATCCDVLRQRCHKQVRRGPRKGPPGYTAANAFHLAWARLIEALSRWWWRTYRAANGCLRPGSAFRKPTSNEFYFMAQRAIQAPVRKTGTLSIKKSSSNPVAPQPRPDASTQPAHRR